MFRSFVVVLVAGIILATSAGWLNLSSLDDLPPPLCDLQSDSDVRYFSQSYFEGRGKFRALSQKLVREQTEDEAVDSFEMLVLEDEVSGQRYTQDVLVIHGGKNGRLFLHFSGTHGPEGFAGSAVQVRVLTEWKRIKETIPLDQRPTVVMIHAMNPYGFANNRRWNENNVDINRNVILTDEKWAKVLSRDENHGGYVDWSTFINPDHAVTLWERVLFYPQAAYFILRYGKHAMMAALVPGTYHRPEGIFYGGQSLQQSHKNVLEMLRTRSFRVMGEEDNDTSTSSFLSHTKSLVMIDVHTGLGRPGVDTIMCKDTTCAKVAERLFPGWSVENEKPGDEERTSAHDARVMCLSCFACVLWAHVCSRPTCMQRTPPVMRAQQLTMPQQGSPLITLTRSRPWTRASPSSSLRSLEPYPYTRCSVPWWWRTQPTTTGEGVTITNRRASQFVTPFICPGQRSGSAVW
eukprot:TRINITY_DN856_c0_g1_i2.p1 TRINITY_DN856_c0_g1~~TRINITY_DN856_c0_g1_i2.p1  ORF type:complete len:473 (+),score=38.57 TRINITY_DN856_c0_g1_i2:35-1420(+)